VVLLKEDKIKVEKKMLRAERQSEMVGKEGVLHATVGVRKNSRFFWKNGRRRLCQSCPYFCSLVLVL
jgi:hypothetical protein